MPRVLLVSEDESLLRIRGLVLAKTGAEVVSAFPEEVQSLLPGGDFDLLVLCHTVREEDRQTLAARSRERWPGLRVLQILKFAYPCPAEPHADLTAVSCEPHEFVALTTALFTAAAAAKLQATSGSSIEARS